MRPALTHALRCALAIGLVLLALAFVGYCTPQPAPLQTTSRG